MTDNTLSFPDHDFVLDLDLEVRSTPEVPPFVVKLGGRKITMTDPETLDWRDLITMTHPTEFLRFALNDEDRKFLLSQGMEQWRFTRLLEAYYAHYGLDDRIREAQRRAQLGV